MEEGSGNPGLREGARGYRQQQREERAVRSERGFGAVGDPR